MIDKSAIELVLYIWSYSKTKIGLGIIAANTVFLWWKIVFPLYGTDVQTFNMASVITIALFFILFMGWLFWSGRITIKKPAFSIVICLKPKDSKSSKYIDNALSMLKQELDKLGLLNKFQIIIAGTDVINSSKQAHKYRDYFDVDLIVWGDVYSGSIENQEVCDFKNLFFTYKIPGNLVQTNLTKYFQNDINIALINRDWNVYEVNSILDTEKITYHLTLALIVRHVLHEFDPGFNVLLPFFCRP